MRTTAQYVGGAFSTLDWELLLDTQKIRGIQKAGASMQTRSRESRIVRSCITLLQRFYGLALGSFIPHHLDPWHRATPFMKQWGHRGEQEDGVYIEI